MSGFFVLLSLFFKKWEVKTYKVVLSFLTKPVYTTYTYKVLNQPLKHVLGVRINAHFTLPGLGNVVRVAAKAHLSYENSLKTVLFIKVLKALYLYIRDTLSTLKYLDNAGLKSNNEIITIHWEASRSNFIFCWDHIWSKSSLRGSKPVNIEAVSQAEKYVKILNREQHNTILGNSMYIVFLLSQRLIEK